MCHGFGGTKVEAHRIFVKLSRDLERLGIASLRFDFGGTGDSAGDFQDIRVSTQIADARRALDWLCRRTGIDAQRIGILGLSLGGMVAACVAGRDKRVKALALWAAVSDLDASVKRLARERKDRIRPMGKGSIDYGGNIMGPAFFAEAAKISPLRDIRDFTGPVCIVHGTKDMMEPVANAQAYWRVVEGKNSMSCKTIVPGADHTFNSFAWEKDVLSVTAKFFNGTLLASC